MKTIVLQTYTGKGFLGDNTNSLTDKRLNHKIMSFCMNSVKNWCSKNNYEYKLILEEDLGWNYFNKRKPNLEESYADREKDLCMQRHAQCLELDADMIIILDNDIFVKKNFKLPEVKVGICVTPWGKYINPNRHIFRVFDRFKIFTQMYETPYPQGGVQFINGYYHKHFNEWLVKSFKSDRWPILWDGVEQSHIFEYTQQYPKNITWLDYKYNCMPKRQTLEEVKNSYLIHFCGPRKIDQIDYLDDSVARSLRKQYANNLR